MCHTIFSSMTHSLPSASGAPRLLCVVAVAHLLCCVATVHCYHAEPSLRKCVFPQCQVQGLCSVVIHLWAVT